MTLAAWARGRSTASVVGVTGSVGKTSTKDFIAAACAVSRRTAANPRSFNNEQGLPVTILNAPDDTEVLVLEMGMRGFGEIARLCEVARPDIGVVTTVGHSHTERVGGIEGVAIAKRELVEALPAAGTAVLERGRPSRDGDGRPHRGDRRHLRTIGRRAHRRPDTRRARPPSIRDPHTMGFVAGGVGDERRPHGDQRGGRDRRRRCARRDSRRCGRRAVGGNRVGDAHAGDGVAERGHGRQRRLQRQPDVDARRARRDRGDDGHTTRGRARTHGRAG